MNSSPVFRASWLGLLLLSCALWVACESKPDLRTAYDPVVDFSKFHSFNFVPITSTQKLGYSTLTTQQLTAAIRAEMEKRGYVFDTNSPDLLVNFSGNLQEKQEIRTSPGSYYGYRSGYYGTWPGYSMSSDVYTVNYVQGTLNVDLVDTSRRQMVWEGVAVGEVTKKHMQDREATIRRAVERIFAKYPFVAGQSQPVQPSGQ